MNYDGPAAVAQCRALTFAQRRVRSACQVVGSPSRPAVRGRLAARARGRSSPLTRGRREKERNELDGDREVRAVDVDPFRRDASPLIETQYLALRSSPRLTRAVWTLQSARAACTCNC